MQIVLFSLCTLFTNCYICCRQCINQYDGGRAKIKDDYHSPLTLWYVSTAAQLSISWILPHVCCISSLTVSLLYYWLFDEEWRPTPIIICTYWILNISRVKDSQINCQSCLSPEEKLDQNYFRFVGASLDRLRVKASETSYSCIDNKPKYGCISS